MSASTEPARRVALAHIRVPDNVRALDDAHVRALAGSIQLQGMLVPLVVRQDGEGVRARGRLFTASPPRVRAAWSMCRLSCVTPTRRTPTARSRTSPASS